MKKYIITITVLILIVVVTVGFFLNFNTRDPAISSRIISVKKSNSNTCETFFTETILSGPSSYIDNFKSYNINEKQLNDIYRSADKYDTIAITVEINNSSKYRIGHIGSVTKGLDDIWIENIASSEAFVVIEAHSTKEIVFSAVVKIEGKSEVDLTNLVRKEFTKIRYSSLSEESSSIFHVIFRIFNITFCRHSSILA